MWFVVAYARCSLTRGFNDFFNDLMVMVIGLGKILVFWKTSHWGKVVATDGSTVINNL